MRHIPEAGAVCGNSARTDLRGGRGVNLRSYRNNRIFRRLQILLPVCYWYQLIS